MTDFDAALPDDVAREIYEPSKTLLPLQASGGAVLPRRTDHHHHRGSKSFGDAGSIQYRFCKLDVLELWERTTP
jgi:hypothetical protein